jgi:glycosyltransferase involved in cell wall biosynthesis
MSAAVEQPHIAAEKFVVPSRTIAFDTWCLGSYARNHGVHVYAGKLLQHWRETAPQHGVEVAPYVSVGVDNDANRFQAAPGFRPRETRLLQHSRLWRFGTACALAARDKADLVFSPHCTTLYMKRTVPAVVTIHDVIPTRMPWASRRITATLRFCAWSAARFSRAIITVSQCSKNDLLDVYGIPESKVFVVYNGCDHRVFNNSPPDPERLRQSLLKFAISRPYVFHHGAIKPNKNLKRLIASYRLVAERNPNLDLELVLAGPLGWEYQDVLAASAQGPGRVIITGPVPVDDLARLLKNAALAVFPSLYEGFCLPMIEAMACGVPVIAARGSCLPEISGGVLRYFDPESVEEMSSCMQEGLENGDLRRELADKGRIWARQFDWRRCAEETMGVLKKQLAISN